MKQDKAGSKKQRKKVTPHNKYSSGEPLEKKNLLKNKAWGPDFSEFNDGPVINPNKP